MDYTVTRGSVNQHTSEIRRSHLRLRDFSPTCTVWVVLSVLFCACSRLCTLTAACLTLRTAPSHETIRKTILHHLPQRDALLRRPHQALTADAPHALRQQRESRSGCRERAAVRANAGRSTQQRSRQSPWCCATFGSGRATSCCPRLDGNHRLNLQCLPLRQMLLWLQHEPADAIGRRDRVPSERPMPSDLEFEIP